MLIVFAGLPADVDFDAMLGKRPSFFTLFKAKSKTKPRESMVHSTFVPAAPFSTSIPTMNPLLKRVADNIPAPLGPPPKRRKCPKKTIASRPMIRDSEEGAALSQGSASPLGPATFQSAPLAVTVDLTSSETLSDTGMGLHSDPPIPLQVELSQPFPPRDPTPALEEFRQIEGKTIMLPRYLGKYLGTPYRVPNLEITDDAPWSSHKFHYHLAKPMLSKRMAAQYRPLQDPYAAMAQSLKHITHAVNGTHVLARRCDHLAWVNHSLGYQIRCMKKDLSHKRGMIERLGKEQAMFKEELAMLSHISEERAKEVADLTREVSLENEAAKGWAAEKATLENHALEQATREKNEALASVASARVQFATQKIREFLASPKYASKIHTECATYLYSLASDYKSRFPDLVTLFGEEKADKPEWYGDLSLSEDSSDEETAEGAEPSTIADGDLEARPSNTIPVLDL
ncbi:hypothetical protein LIER_23368 [Lithospermum erythrorhizon]|uniref:Uncharacterized protein n=1 Tax=Lithospermum erythrorhizon TaxID=34254 RepID=A0AAV3QYH5_LITER